MAKTQKELAFLRDLYIDEQWTKRFTDLIDTHVKIGDCENLLYINAGTGNHAFSVQEKLKKTVAVFAACEDDDLLQIARDKAAAISSDIDFSRVSFEDDVFDTVIADASFVAPTELREFVDESVRVAKPGGTAVFFSVSAGSFGEIFSLLWEVLIEEDLGEHGAAAERLVAQIPTVSDIESLAAMAGLINLKTHTASEIFEYENGAEFVNSSLIGDFLLPVWLDALDENEKERVSARLARLIDDEDGSLTFQFTVKATLVTGEKA